MITMTYCVICECDDIEIVIKSITKLRLFLKILFKSFLSSSTKEKNKLGFENIMSKFKGNIEVVEENQVVSQRG